MSCLSSTSNARAVYYLHLTATANPTLPRHHRDRPIQIPKRCLYRGRCHRSQCWLSVSGCCNGPRRDNTFDGRQESWSYAHWRQLGYFRSCDYTRVLEVDHKDMDHAQFWLGRCRHWCYSGERSYLLCRSIVWKKRRRLWKIFMANGRLVSEQMVNAVGMGFVMLEVEYGLGRHVRFLPQDQYEGFLKYNFLDWIQVFVTLALSKISICLFLLRISKFERWRWFLFGLIGFLVLTHVPLTLLFLFQCIPLQKNWETVEEAVPGHCMSKKAVEKIIIVQGGESTLDLKDPGITSAVCCISRNDGKEQNTD